MFETIVGDLTPAKIEQLQAPQPGEMDKIRIGLVARCVQADANNAMKVLVAQCSL